jgi:hypothetical protein
MRSTDADRNGTVLDDQAPPSPTVPYEPPTLVLLGSLDDLTASMGDSGSTDVFFTISP